LRLALCLTTTMMPHNERQHDSIVLSAPVSRDPQLAVLDSGVGGLATLELILEACPNLAYSYLADGAYFPYGPKPALLVRERVAQLMDTVAEQCSVSAFVIACNTAAQEELCQRPMPFPVYDPIDSTCRAIQAAFQHKSQAHIALLATPTTVDTGRYPKLLTPQFGMTQLVTAELVTAIEAGHAWDSPEMHAVLAPIFERIRDIEPDAIVLGCTHFSWVVPAFEAAFPDIALFNSAECLARDVISFLQTQDCPMSLDAERSQRILNTRPSQDFTDFLHRLGFTQTVSRFDVPNASDEVLLAH
jgi:glutamate racemase